MAVYLLAMVIALVIYKDRLLVALKNLKQWWERRQFQEHQTYYHSIVSTHSKFYNGLSLTDQEKFLWRTYQYMRARKFHYVDVEPSPEKPMLVSAAAVQLTFGLDKFMMSYFEDVYIMKEDNYQVGFAQPEKGHVNHSGIYLCWESFISGMHGAQANANVGLHEMGHALTYVNLITQTESDPHFKKEFKYYSKVARPLFDAMQKGYTSVLGSYAASNFQEFWAVSVEFFFENPLKLKEELPALYNALKRLLKQDPLQEGFFSSKAA
jgi:hypothetical protein